MKKNLIFFVLIFLLIFFLTSIFYEINKRHICNKSYLTFTFDDGYEEQYTAAFPILKKYNVSATVYVMPSLIGDYFENQKLMDLFQLNDLKNNGWEIGSHTIDHKRLTELNSTEIHNELKLSKKLLEENYFDIKTLAIPYGAYNEEIKEISKKYYLSTRPSIWGSNSLSNLDLYSLKSFWIVNSTSLNDIKIWIDESQKNKEWIIFMLHLIRNDKGLEYSISPSDLENIIIYAKQKNIEIKTISEVIELKCKK